MERIGSGDLTQLATDVGPVAMNVGAVLVLDPGSSGFDPARCPQGARRTDPAHPDGCANAWPRAVGVGPPVWVDAEGFDPAAQIATLSCPQPGDHVALLELAVAEVTRPLPRDRPLWRALVVTGLADERVALVVVLHHVVADGVGGLAVLASLADNPAAPTVRPPGARPLPTYGRLAAENASARVRSLRRAPERCGSCGRRGPSSGRAAPGPRPAAP